MCRLARWPTLECNAIRKERERIGEKGEGGEEEEEEVCFK